MSIYDQLLKSVKIPKFVKVHYNIQQSCIREPAEETQKVIDASKVMDVINPGASVCIACGSREIANLKTIVKNVVAKVKGKGGIPFIIPAMGSHGGATAAGQREILVTYGLGDADVGAPIKATMETTKLGETESGLEARIDQFAAEADVIILVARIKPHTDFRGKVESGLMKMISIGMGKQYGASICHSKGFENMARNVHDIASVVIEKHPNIIGIGIIENTFHETYRIVALPGERFDDEEPRLLEQAKMLMPKIPFKKCDTLFVDEIGKNISGPGMDPNITGRSVFLGRSEPFFDGIAVFDLTDESHHNGNGIGNADVTTRRFFNKFSMEVTYPNSITCLDPSGVKLPAIMPNDYLAMKFALNLAYLADAKTGPRVVWLHNTLCMYSFLISENLIPSALKIKGISIETKPQEARFDDNQNLIPVDWS
ncbi:MAG: nickel-dependent lactate racemase [Spirochaetia bacterium]|jgi:hypothetical protein|nr:nickel-dependent lactate racemase [Spirochaetia bacterium]